jgi:ornithine--oxo-acid transaminase
LCCAAALAALDVFVGEAISKRSIELVTQLRSTLEAANIPHVTAFNRAGLFMALILEEKAPKVTLRIIVSSLAQPGVLASAAVLRRIRICPPLTTTKGSY